MTAAEENTKAARLWPYVRQFIPIYIGLSIAVAVALFVFELQTNAGVNVAVLVPSLVLPINTFVSDYQRPFDRSERLRFTFLIFLASIVASLALLAVAGVIVFSIDHSAPSMEEVVVIMRLFVWQIALSVFVTSLVYLAVIYFFSGFYARFLSKRLVAMGEA